MHMQTLPSSFSGSCRITRRSAHAYANVVIILQWLMQDHEEISALDIAEAVSEMYARRRYKNLFIVLETCQAATMFTRVRSPGAFVLAASRKGVVAIVKLIASGLYDIELWTLDT
jgi:hypothetical protein